MLALEGIRILDLSRYLPGSVTSLGLADFGAEVIMIENPATGGEPGRRNAPYINGVSARHLMLQRNKKSLTLDLKSPDDQLILRKLLETADVVLENFQAGFLQALGLDYAAAEKINPRIIYCSLSGYNRQGSAAGQAGHDLNYLASAGLLSLAGSPGTPPPIPGVQIADLSGALLAQTGILIALSARDKTGRGQEINIAFNESAMSLLPLIAAAYFAEDKVYQPGEHLYTGGMAWYNVYAASDGRYLAVGALEPKFWHKLCDTLGVPEFKALQFEADQQAAMRGKLQSIFSTKTQAVWLAELTPLNICVNAVRTVGEALDDADAAPEMIYPAAHPVAGSIRQIRSPIKLSRTPASERMPAPALGEHNREILMLLGYSPEDINRFEARHLP